jgi:hypothetical protein
MRNAASKGSTYVHASVFYIEKSLINFSDIPMVFQQESAVYRWHFSDSIPISPFPTA